MGSSISAKIVDISKAVNMYLATSISHLPISRFISCSTMLQNYKQFLKQPNNPLTFYTNHVFQHRGHGGHRDDCNRLRVYQEKPNGFSQSHAAVWSRSLCAEPRAIGQYLQTEKYCGLPKRQRPYFMKIERLDTISQPSRF